MSIFVDSCIFDRSCHSVLCSRDQQVMAIFHHHRCHHLYPLQDRHLSLLNLIAVFFFAIISGSGALCSSSHPPLPATARRDVLLVSRSAADTSCLQFFNSATGSGYYSIPILCTEDNDCPTPGCKCVGRYDTYQADFARIYISYGARAISAVDEYGVGFCASSRKTGSSSTSWNIGRALALPPAPHSASLFRHRKDRSRRSLPLECMTEMVMSIGTVALPISCWEDSDCPNGSTTCQCNGRWDEAFEGYILYGYHSRGSEISHTPYGQGFCGYPMPRGRPIGRRDSSRQSISQRRSISPRQPTSPRQPIPPSTPKHLPPRDSYTLPHPPIPLQCMIKVELSPGRSMMTPIACYDDDDCVRQRRGNPYRCQCNGAFDEDFGSWIRFGFKHALGGTHPYPYGVGLCGAVYHRARPIG